MDRDRAFEILESKSQILAHSRRVNELEALGTGEQIGNPRRKFFKIQSSIEKLASKKSEIHDSDNTKILSRASLTTPELTFDPNVNTPYDQIGVYFRLHEHSRQEYSTAISAHVRFKIKRDQSEIDSLRHQANSEMSEEAISYDIYEYIRSVRASDITQIDETKREKALADLADIYQTFGEYEGLFLRLSSAEAKLMRFGVSPLEYSAI